MIGHELALNPSVSRLEKLYIRVFGVPISGLRIRLRRILPKLNGYKPAKVLDAGCGRGIFTYQLARKFPSASVVGVDIDKQLLKMNALVAASAGLSNIVFHSHDVASLPFDREFDLVISVDNLEHLEDDDAGINSLARAVKPHGILILHVPGYERRWMFFRFRTNFDVPGHFRPGYRLEEITAKVRTAGFCIKEAYYTYGWLETVTNNFSYLVTRAEAKNKAIYAILFPVLNGLAWLGRNARPKKGAGVLIVATK